jgi:flagellar motor protein MotB
MSDDALHGPAEGGSDGYMASMTDLLVGMLFIFIIMLMTFALSYRSAQDEHMTTVDTLAAMVEEISRKTAILERGQALLAENQKVLDHMLGEVQDALRQQGVKATVEESGVIRLRDSMPFRSGDADLDATAARTARILSEVFTRILPCYTAAASPRAGCPAKARPILEGVFVEGHTDNQPISGRFRDNWVLSTARASSTYEAIKATAPNLANLRNASGKVVFGVSGYGEGRPVAGNDTDAGRALNRRIDVRFLLSTPTPEQLERIRREAEAVK